MIKLNPLTGKFDMVPVVPSIGTTAGTVAAGNDSRLGTISVTLPDGTSGGAASGIQATPGQTVVSGVLGGLPRYVSGRDAANLLARLKDTSAKSIFVVGDSRSVNMANYAGYSGGGFTGWAHIPLGGCDGTVPPVIGNIAAFGEGASTAKPLAAGAVTASAVFVGENVNDYCFGAIEDIWTSTTSRAEANHIWNLLMAGAIITANVPLLTASLADHALRIYYPVRMCPTGTVNARVALQVYTNSNYTTAPDWVRGSYFSTYAATSYMARKVITLPAHAVGDFGNGINCMLVFDTTPGVVNEVVAGGRPWVEREDGYGAVLFDMTLGGSVYEDFLEGAQYRVNKQHPDATIASEIKLRTHMREPWLMVDLGTNGQILEGGVYPTTAHITAQLTRLIERWRQVSGYPNMPVILRTAYPDINNRALDQYQEADLAVAARLPNVMCVDTHAAAYDGGGYTNALARGWQGPGDSGVHRGTNGRYALESMFDAIISGEDWDYSSTLG